MAGVSNDILTALKGAAMGAANVIPGVSGGTIAFITGIYERLINAIKSCDLTAAKLLLGRRFREFDEHVDFRFLLAIGVGAVVAIACLAKVLEDAFKNHPIPTWAFFFGLIVASIWGVGKMVKCWDAKAIGALLLGLGIAGGVLFLPHASGNSNFFYLVICGAVAISSMIIPGVSGSFVLLLMGNYVLILSAVVACFASLRSFSFGAELVGALSTLAPFGIGCVLGLVVLSRVLSWVFAHHHDVAVALITGFIVGSLALIWPWKDTIYKVDEAGAYLVKNGDREVVARAGDIEGIRAGLDDSKEEELLTAGYENWQLPSMAEDTTKLAIGMILLGAFLVGLIEVMGAKYGRKQHPDEATAG
jgi:putative membrane protein